MLLNFYLKNLTIQPNFFIPKKFFYLNYYRRIRLLDYKVPYGNLEVFFFKNTKKTKLQNLLSIISLRKANQLNLYTLWFILYQQIYLSELLKLPINFKSFNGRDVIPYSLLKYVVHSVRSIKWKRYSIMHSNEIIETLFLCLWLKNIKLFMEWMRGYFEKSNLKKHRKLFLLLNLLLGKLVWNYNIFLQLKGLRISLRGKFGKAGSVRKTRRYIRRGRCSYTTKNIALISQTNVIRTLTGVFSIKFEVFF